MTHLKLIKGGKPEHEVLSCPVCNGSTLIPVIVGAFDIVSVEDGLNITGGCDQMICAQCLSEGNIETVFSSQSDNNDPEGIEDGRP